MDCEAVTEKLSAFLDGELGSSEELDVQRHLTSCETCRAEFEQFDAMGNIIRRCESCEMQLPEWDSIESRLERAEVLTMWPSINRSRWLVSVLVTAASIGFIWLAVSSFRNTRHGGHSHQELAVDFQDVFRLAQTDPQAAIGKLVARYQGKELDRDGTIAYLGYEPTLFQTMPVGFNRTSTHVLSMPCCKCSATVCQRQDGTSLVVFEHKNEQPVWFGDAPCIETQCAGQACKIIESAGSLAVTWKNKDRQLTMVGAKNVNEVSEWVSALKM